MEDLQQNYNELLTKKLKAMNYEENIDFLFSYLPSIPISQLFMTPTECKEFYHKKMNYFAVGNLFNSMINLKPSEIHSDYETAMDILGMVIDASTRWENVVAPIRQEIYTKVTRDQAMNNKKIIQQNNGIVIPGNFKR